MRFIKILAYLTTLIIIFTVRQQCFAIGQESTNSIKLGSTGSDVVTVQCKLEMTKDSADKSYFKLPQGAVYGSFGEVTKTAVKNFQKDNNLSVDGEVGTSDNVDETWTKLGLSKGEFILSKGSKDSNVLVLQDWLTNLNIYKETVDGNFGAITENAVNQYKDKNSILNTDVYKGKVGKTTWGYMYSDVQKLQNTTSATSNGKTISVETAASSDTSDPWKASTSTKQAVVTVGEHEIEGALISRDGTVVTNIANTAFELGANLANGTRLTDSYFEFEVYHPDTITWNNAGYYKNQLYTNPIGSTPMISVNKLANDLGFGDKITVTTNKDGSKVVYIDKVDDGRQLLNSISSLAVSLIPGIGDTKDIQEGVTGYDILTGQKLSPNDRCISVACSFLPVVSGKAVRIGKKGMSEIDNVIKTIDKLSDTEKATFRVSTWVQNPFDRGEIIEKVVAKTDYNTAKTGWHSMADLGYKNFPVIDFWRGKEVLSLKTIDPWLYNDGDGVMSKLKDYLRNLRDTQFLYTDTNKIVTKVKNSNKTLDIRVPVGTMSKINLRDLEREADNVIITLKEF